MFRLLFVFVLSLAVSSQAIAAVKWNNSGGEESKSDPTNFWDRTKNAKKCFGPEFDHFSDKISIKKITVQDKDFAAVNTPLGANASVNCKFNYSSQLVPQPLIDAKINSKYGGSDNKRFQPFYEFLNTNIGLNRFEPNGAAQGRLKEFLITWSSANALSKNIRFKLMKDFRLDFHVQSLIPTIIIAYSDISGSLSPQERIQVGQWINRLVEQSQKSAFPFRQDNKSYLRHLTALRSTYCFFFGVRAHPLAHAVISPRSAVRHARSRQGQARLGARALLHRVERPLATAQVPDLDRHDLRGAV